MIHFLLELSGKYLIEFMGAMLGLCFFMRWVSYLSSKRNDAYFSTLAREITIGIEKDKDSKVKVDDLETYLGHFFHEINEKLPNRSLRFKQEDHRVSGKATISINQYLNGRENFVNILKAESGVFHCQTPPNFSELTQRILGQDKHWTTMLKTLPVDGISRLIDIMSGLFVVFGVFGTFVGISLALPEIAKIDFNNVEGSASTLTHFVTNTAYSMETSLAGILFSVLMTVMNALYPIKDMRNRIHKKVETSLQTLWYHVQYAKRQENDLAMTLEAIRNALEKLADQEQKSLDLPPAFDEKKAS
jgi:hypothetical protein